MIRASLTTLRTAGLVGGGWVPARVAAAAGAEIASPSAGLYKINQRPRRSFEEDYPRGALGDDTGKLRFDIEGRPLTARNVVGRTLVGGGDTSLSTRAHDEIAEATTGQSAVVASQAPLGSDTWGYTLLDAQTPRPLGIVISRDLSPKQAERTYRHEIGHVVDEITGQIPSGGLLGELRSVYHEVNTGHIPKPGQLAPGDAGYDRSPEHTRLFGPEQQG